MAQRTMRVTQRGRTGWRRTWTGWRAQVVWSSIL